MLRADNINASNSFIDDFVNGKNAKISNYAMSFVDVRRDDFSF